MNAQPTSVLSQSRVPDLRIEAETCPWCGQEIPPEKLEEISGRIAAKEREHARAITAKLQKPYLTEKAEADARAKAQLELERQESARREALAREEARKAAETAALEKIAGAEQSRRAMQAKLAEIEAISVAAEHKTFVLQEQLEQVKKSKEDEVARIEEAAVAEINRIRREASEATESLVREKTASEKAVIEAQAKCELADRKLAKQSEEFEDKLNERLRFEREALEKAKEDAVNLERAKAFEETQKLSNKVADLQRALDNKTADELGEGAELDLFEALKSEFPYDRITRIAKGTPGADIKHVVLCNGQECGTIIYDSKNHKAFRNDHVEKLREDQIAARAEHAILSTHRFPQKTRQLHIQDGVLLANPARVLAVVTLIREHLLQSHTLRLSNAERKAKTAKLYAFITSERCRQLFSRIDSHTEDLLEQQVKEKKWHESAWKKQGEAICSIQRVKGELSTEIGRIIGVAPDDGLEPEESDE